MRRFQDISIRRKLTVIIMIASTFALLLVSAGFMTYEWSAMRKDMVVKLSELARVVGDHSQAALVFLNEKDATEILNALHSDTHIVGAALYDADGRLFAQYGTPQKLPNRSAFPREAEKCEFTKDRLVGFYKINKDSDLVGTLYLESDLQEINQRFWNYAGIVLLFIIISALITLVLSNFLQRVISRPIFHLAGIAKKVSTEKNYSVRAEKHGADELGQLIDGFNEMLGQIQGRDDELQTARNELENRVQERTQELRAEITERRRAEDQLRQQFVRISLLNQITHAISDRQDMESIFHVVLHHLEEHLGLDLGGGGLFNSETKALNVAALRIKNSLLATQLDLREGSVLSLAETDFQLCENGQTVYLSDTVKSPSAFSEKLAGLGWRSVVAVPLRVEAKLFGVMIFARLNAFDFSSGDCEFLRMLSEHVALAAHQAKLHGDLESAYNELRRTQATVLQQERLKALGQMASGIAHDVNNALSPVVGFSELLLKGDFGLDQKGKNYLRYISTAGHDIAHIISRLKEFYRKRDDAESLQRLNLNLLAEEVVEMTRPRWRDIPQANGITIEVETQLASDVPRLVGIESEIREAFTNLILNAVDAMPKGGKIILRTTMASVENGDDPTRKVVVEISDTGLGMSEETRKRCLEPFFSTKGKRGTGLGLAMVYGVMQRHEGNIEIQSAAGKGTTFRLTFPVRDRLQIGSEATEFIAKPEPMRILCIDDEPLLRELVKEMLERDGHAVEVSDSGQSGLDQFRHARSYGRPFDVVITDLGMPYLDGRQVAKAIKQESPATPVVMLTGWGALMREDGDAPEQVDAVLSKPPRSRDLRETLRRFHPVNIAHDTVK